MIRLTNLGDLYTASCKSILSKTTVERLWMSMPARNASNVRDAFYGWIAGLVDAVHSDSSDVLSYDAKLCVDAEELQFA